MMPPKNKHTCYTDNGTHMFKYNLKFLLPTIKDSTA